ncbi:hypothetical protein BDDG_11912 [Blastomyces dermatitidis ATCC 18188]|uniref:Uncharacterized protein n=1 Tax=Ajellomyces dermatitidis (strain ATCC 18188 / CBS 674.68) TaxID=653446 RepID=A0A0J9ELB4_AJEDA|nr:hypothetical protein BDDG_11912 [Blastomyces dermatitidis ATCC 18188]
MRLNKVLACGVEGDDIFSELNRILDPYPSDESRTRFATMAAGVARYHKSTGEDLQKVPRFTSVEYILKDAELQQTTFNRFRHDGELIDRL